MGKYPPLTAGPQRPLPPPSQGSRYTTTNNQHYSGGGAEYEEEFRHRLGGGHPAPAPPPAPPSAPPSDMFRDKIHEFRTGLLVTDPRLSYTITVTPTRDQGYHQGGHRQYHSDHGGYNKYHSDPAPQRGHDKYHSEPAPHRGHQEAEQQRRRPRPGRGRDPSVSGVAGPPYPGPPPRNPRLPLDNTIIYP